MGSINYCALCNIFDCTHTKAEQQALKTKRMYEEYYSRMERERMLAGIPNQPQYVALDPGATSVTVSDMVWGMAGVTSPLEGFLKQQQARLEPAPPSKLLLLLRRSK